MDTRSRRISHSPHQLPHQPEETTTGTKLELELDRGLSEAGLFGLWMQRKGYRHSTIKHCVKNLRTIAKRTNLLNPEAAKSYLATAALNENTKNKVCEDLTRFYNHKGLKWERPNYRRIGKLPFIPLESEIDQLIGALGPKTACFMSLTKDTAARPGETWRTSWTDIDFQRGVVSISPEKDSNPRQPKLSNQTLAMIMAQPKKYQYVFMNPAIDPDKSLDDFRRNYEMARTNIATKLANPRLRQISFRTLRHWKATMEYHRTKDILHVMQLLGHRNIKNTLVYTHLVNFKSDDDYICKVASTLKAAEELIEAGFDYVTDMESQKLFRKRK